MLKKFRGSRDADHAHFENFQGIVTGLSLRTRLSNFKFVTLTVLEQVAFNAQKFRGHVILVTPLFEKF